MTALPPDERFHPVPGQSVHTKQRIPQKGVHFLVVLQQTGHIEQGTVPVIERGLGDDLAKLFAEDGLRRFTERPSPRRSSMVTNFVFISPFASSDITKKILFVRASLEPGLHDVGPAVFALDDIHVFDQRPRKRALINLARSPCVSSPESSSSRAAIRRKLPQYVRIAGAQGPNFELG